MLHSSHLPNGLIEKCGIKNVFSRPISMAAMTRNHGDLK